MGHRCISNLNYRKGISTIGSMDELVYQTSTCNLIYGDLMGHEPKEYIRDR